MFTVDRDRLLPGSMRGPRKTSNTVTLDELAIALWAARGYRPHSPRDRRRQAKSRSTGWKARAGEPASLAFAPPSAPDLSKITTRTRPAPLVIHKGFRARLDAVAKCPNVCGRFGCCPIVLDGTTVGLRTTCRACPPWGWGLPAAATPPCVGPRWHRTHRTSRSEADHGVQWPVRFGESPANAASGGELILRTVAAEYLSDLEQPTWQSRRSMLFCAAARALGSGFGRYQRDPSDWIGECESGCPPVRTAAPSLG